MTILRFQIPTHSTEVAGTPVSVDIIDSAMQVRRQTVRFDAITEVDLPLGAYTLRAYLPSGETLSASCTLTPDTPPGAVVRIEPPDPTPHEWLEWGYVLQDIQVHDAARLRSFGAATTWVRLWRRGARAAPAAAGANAGWAPRPWPGETWKREKNLFECGIPGSALPQILQIGGADVPWTLVALPCGPGVHRLRLLVRLADRPAPGRDAVQVAVATENRTGEALLGYLSSGATHLAAVVGDELANRAAETHLEAKLGDPTAAAIGAYYLLRVGDLARLHDWANNLANWIPWLPDGAVIHAWQLLRQPQPDATQARQRLLQAVERGLPIYTEGLRLLYDGLQLFDADAEGRDEPITAALGQLRPFVAAMNPAAPTITFTGRSPTKPSAVPVFGLPGDLRGLSYLLWPPPDGRKFVHSSFFARLLAQTTHSLARQLAQQRPDLAAADAAAMVFSWFEDRLDAEPGFLSAEQFPTPERFSAYLRQAVLNAATLAEEQRRRGEEVSAPPANRPLVPIRVTPTATPEQIEQLPEPHRTLLLRLVFDEEPLERIAAGLDQTVEQTQDQYIQALDLLKRRSAPSAP
jgi:hypothetical protein